MDRFSREGNERKNYLAICLPLYEAALKGDWEAAKEIKNHETALHIASSTKHVYFVEKLVNLMKPEDLELQNKNFNTVLCLAAAAGTVKIAEILVAKNSSVQMKREKNMLPVLVAAWFGQKNMVSFLYSLTDNMTCSDHTDMDRENLLHACISANLYDVALKLLHHHKEKLALATDQNALHVLARNPTKLVGTRQPVFWRLLNTILPGPRIGPGENKCQALEIVRIIWGEIVEQTDDEILWNIIRGPVEILKVRERNLPYGKLIDKSVHPSRLLFVAAALGNSKSSFTSSGKCLQPVIRDRLK
ncbi:uncharacterized protein LOC141690247 isoform X1 [Apium graveolens]|uniref:uncharacterized protein LOC141690247 isoform X1 n=1 Tax=Apium graveolens TaxID=4045 RepID=UPI003D7A9CC4